MVLIRFGGSEVSEFRVTLTEPSDAMRLILPTWRSSVLWLSLVRVLSVIVTPVFPTRSIDPAIPDAIALGLKASLLMTLFSVIEIDPFAAIKISPEFPSSEFPTPDDASLKILEFWTVTFSVTSTKIFPAFPIPKTSASRSALLVKEREFAVMSISPPSPMALVEILLRMRLPSRLTAPVAFTTISPATAPGNPKSSAIPADRVICSDRAIFAP